MPPTLHNSANNETRTQQDGTLCDSLEYQAIQDFPSDDLGLRPLINRMTGPNTDAWNVVNNDGPRDDGLHGQGRAPRHSSNSKQRDLAGVHVGVARPHLRQDRPLYQPGGTHEHGNEAGQEQCDPMQVKGLVCNPNKTKGEGDQEDSALGFREDRGRGPMDTGEKKQRTSWRCQTPRGLRL